MASEDEGRVRRRLAEGVALASVVVALGWIWWIAVREGYRLFGDAAVIQVRAHDVFGPGSPLLGMPSAFSAWSSAADPMHPGPAVFWLLAPTELVVGGVHGALLGTFLVAVVAAWWSIRNATRRVGPVGALVAAIAVLATAGYGFNVWEPLNPSIGMLISLGVSAAAWSVLDGEDRQWPWMLLGASIVIQADLAFVPSTAITLVGVLVATAVRWRRDTPDDAARRQRRSVLCWSAFVLAALWCLPLAEALVNDGGNLWEGWKAMRAGVPSSGVAAAADALWFCFRPAIFLSPLLVVAWRQRLPARRALMLAALLAGVGAAVGQYLVPAGETGSLVTVPLEVNSVFVWTATVALAVDVIRSWAMISTPIVVGVASIVLVGTAVRSVNDVVDRPWWGRELFASIEPLGAAVSRLGGGPYRVQPLSAPYGVALAEAIVGEVVDTPVELRFEQPLARYLGGTRRIDGSESEVLYVTLGAAIAPTDSAELVERWEPPDLDRPQQEALEGRVADAVRSDGPVWAPLASSFFVGSIAAGLGGGDGGPIDNDVAIEIGQRLLDDPSAVRRLPDAAVAELVAQRQLVLPAEREQLVAQLQTSRSSLAANLWRDRVDPDEGS